MERFRDFHENIDSLYNYGNCGLPFDEQLSILSNKDKLKDWLLHSSSEYYIVYENLTLFLDRYCDDSSIIDRLYLEDCIDEEDENLLLDIFCDYIVNRYSFSWLGGCEHASDLTPHTKVRLYRMVSVDSPKDFSFSKEHMGVCWTCDKEVLDNLQVGVYGDVILYLEADTEAKDIDLLTSTIYVYHEYANETEVRLMRTDSVDLLNIYDDSWNKVWSKEEGWL